MGLDEHSRGRVLDPAGRPWNFSEPPGALPVLGCSDSTASSTGSDANASCLVWPELTPEPYYSMRS